MEREGLAVAGIGIEVAGIAVGVVAFLVTDLLGRALARRLQAPGPVRDTKLLTYPPAAVGALLAKDAVSTLFGTGTWMKAWGEPSFWMSMAAVWGIAGGIWWVGVGRHMRATRGAPVEGNW